MPPATAQKYSIYVYHYVSYRCPYGIIFINGQCFCNPLVMNLHMSVKVFTHRSEDIVTVYQISDV